MHQGVAPSSAAGLRRRRSEPVLEADQLFMQSDPGRMPELRTHCGNPCLEVIDSWCSRPS